MGGGACSDSQKFFPNGIALLGEPAVALTSQAVITFENGYNTDKKG